MDSNSRSSLAGFEARLLGELRDLVTMRALQPSVTPPAYRTGRRPGGWFQWASTPSVATGLIVVAIASAAILVASLGGSSPQLADAFPLFATPTVDASHAGIIRSFLRSQGEVPARTLHVPDAFASNVAFTAAVRHAHAFPTSFGTGYAFSTHFKGDIFVTCVIFPTYQYKQIPEHGGWGGSCGATRTPDQAGPLQTTLYAPHAVEFLELVRAGTSATLTYADGRTVNAPITNGVLHLTLHTRAVLKVHGGGSTSTYTLEPSSASASKWETSRVARRPRGTDAEMTKEHAGADR